jgi:hypothetical protein
MKLFFQFILILILTSCSTPTVPSPTPSPLFPEKQPEPVRPLIAGQISGLAENALLTIHIATPEGYEAAYYTQKGNGRWEAVVTSASGVDYVITAEADGYVSSPTGYSIHLSDTTAYLVEEGRVTQDEALDLDFHFQR